MCDIFILRTYDIKGLPKPIKSRQNLKNNTMETIYYEGNEMPINFESIKKMVEDETVLDYGRGFDSQSNENLEKIRGLKEKIEIVLYGTTDENQFKHGFKYETWIKKQVIEKIVKLL